MILLKAVSFSNLTPIQKLNNRNSNANTFLNSTINQTIANATPATTLPTHHRSSSMSALPQQLNLQRANFTPNNKGSTQIQFPDFSQTDSKFFTQSFHQANSIPSHIVPQTYTPGAFALNTDRGSKQENSTISGVQATTTKLDKLCEKFLKEKQNTPAFKDTFFDKDIFQGIKSSRNYQHLCEQLLTYVLHSSNKTPEDGS